METNNRSIKNFDDLVFENRHKEYGAYAIRKSYNDNVTCALFLTCVFFGLLALAPAIVNKNEPVVNKPDPKIIDTLISVPFVITPSELKDDLKKTVEKKIFKSDILNYQVKDKEVESKVKTNEQAVIIKDGIEKGKDTTDIKDGIEKGKDTTDIKDVPDKYVMKDPVPIKNDIEDYVDQMPEFDGNLYKFFKDQIRYPRAAVENGTFGIVGLSFVVEKDGSIGAIKILNSIGDGCTEEAIRVIKSMPKWKPGKNHGELVRVRYNIPVKFRLK